VNRILRIAAVAALALVLALLLGPATAVETGRPGLDKIAHFASFGLVLWSLGVLFQRRCRLHLALAALAIGALTEGIQALVGRDADLLDFVADALGVAVALGVWAAWRGFRPRRHLNPSAS
jgi:VanZ family protein